MDFKLELDLFIRNAEANLLEVTKKFGWDIQTTQETLDVKFQCCPINKEHRVPENKMKHHLEKCKLRSQGYSMDDTFLQPLDKDMLNNPRVVVMDKYKQQKILTEALRRNRKLKISTHLREPPLTFDRYLCEFTSDERYVLYDHVIQQTSNQVTSQQQDGFHLGFDDITKSKTKECPQTLQDLLAAERNSKRRRQAHRKKNPQGGKKSDTETLREIIQSQMEYFYNKKDHDIINNKNVQPNIKWRYGKRLNVQNYYRQWEVIDDDDKKNNDRKKTSFDDDNRNEDRTFNDHDRNKGRSINDDGRCRQNTKNSDHEQSKVSEYDGDYMGRRKYEYDTSRQDSKKYSEYIRSEDTENKKKTEDNRRYEARNRSEYREQTKHSCDKESKSYDRGSSRSEYEHRNVRSKTHKKRHRKKSRSKSPKFDRNLKRCRSRSPFDKYARSKKKSKKSRERSKRDDSSFSS